MTSLYKSLILLLQGLALICVLGLSALILLGGWMMHRHQIRLLGVETGSMVPTLHIGDGLLVKPVSLKNVQVGDIVSYRTSLSGSIISHRVVSINRSAHQFVPKGDSNSQPDGIVAGSQLVGRATAVAPFVEKGLNLLKNPVQLMAIVYVPATIAIVCEVRRLERAWARPYRAGGLAAR